MKTEPRLAMTGMKRSPRMVGDRVVATGSVGSVWLRTSQNHSRRVTDEEESRSFVQSINLGMLAFATYGRGTAKQGLGRQ